MSVFSGLVFDNRFTRELPADPDSSNRRRPVRGACYSRVKPTPVASPKLIGWSSDMAIRLGLPAIPGSHADELARVLGGNVVVDGMDPFAMCYGGHQFGNWAGQLGDGRAINLGEVKNAAGEYWTLQLKGAGPTPYSRTADGLAVLRSSVREFLCSEAMHWLGVPTTRALSLVTTGEQVVRDMFYDGNPQREPGAVVCRVAPSFTRFGNFQILAARSEREILNKLIDHTIVHDFQWTDPASAETRTRWFHEVCRRTADMIVHWMRVGFVHGVMNTDNMSILGLTIDYGPYGWLENYDPDWTPNTTDASGRRYAFAQQPQIALWNLIQLANSLATVFPGVEPLQAGIDLYTSHFNAEVSAMMNAKLGLPNNVPEEVSELSGKLLEILSTIETDMTIFYRTLGNVRLDTLTAESSSNEWEAVIDELGSSWYRPDQATDTYRQTLKAWLLEYRTALQSLAITDDHRRASMARVNPKFVLRNYLAQLAIDRAEQGDNGLIEELLQVLQRPYDDQPEKDHLAQKRPDWARHRAGCSMLSCSS
ncbi:MAG: YdiU family protein [Planctomycetaceae bacterium]|nr:YdiU family protein [Planctomycetaceae bacterium]